VYFDLGTGDDYVYRGITNFTGLHTQNELQLSDRQKGLYAKTIPGELYPEYYIIKVDNFDNVAKDSLDEWIYYLRNNEIEDHFSAKGLDVAREVLAYDNLSDEDKIAYRESVKNRRIINGVMETYYTDGIIKGKAIGLEEGEAIGLEKGEAERNQLKAERDQLKAEKEKDREKVLIKSHQAGLPIETISAITGLTPEQIAEILKRHGLV
jgi:hypothetical protein